MEFVIIIVLILMNGFFSLSEMALISCRKSGVERYKSEGKKGAKYTLKLLENSEKFLSAIQVGITLIGIITGMYGGMNLAGYVEPLFDYFSFTRPYSAEIALVLTVILITYVSIVIGELVPKTIALGNPDRIAVFVSPVIHYFSAFFYPFVKLLSASTLLFKKLLGVKSPSSQLTESELRQIIKTASIDGVIGKEQNTLHEKVFFFYDKKAKHIMTHRKDVVWFDINDSAESIRSFLLNVKHSKVVCAKNDLDDFQGVVVIHDFLKQIIDEKNVSKPFVCQPVIVPENTDARKILNILREAKSQICFVVNEYGGFEGIITLHDIFENLVGEIPDEGEILEPNIFVREDGSFLANGDAPVEILCHFIEGFTIDFEKIDYSTIAGFVFEKLNKMPQVGDNFIFMNYKFEIVDIDSRRIDKVLISKAL